jgi:hypothetical protein
MVLPTSACDQYWHDREGGCYQCCDGCNYDTHRCHFCGDDLMHGDRDYGTGRAHTCYVECILCTHIGHEHIPTCRGTEYLPDGLHETHCECVLFMPRFDS